MSRVKLQHWIDFLEEATTKDIWTANKYISTPATDGGKSKIPALKQKTANGQTTELTTNEEKAEALATSFFPPKPTKTTVPVEYNYLEPLPPPTEITINCIQEHIEKLSPYKASGPDRIPNIILQRAVSNIKNHLLHIYQAIFNLQTYADSWREFTTVVLQKPGKLNYEITKAY
ncbi:hypothetical protein CVT25_000254, partial [Psilocybe cyanescens]